MKIPIIITLEIETDNYEDWKKGCPNFFPSIIENHKENDFITESSVTVFRCKKNTTLKKIEECLNKDKPLPLTKWYSK